MTHSELVALELQARIMGWAPAVTWDCVIVVPAPQPEPVECDGLDHSEY